MYHPLFGELEYDEDEYEGYKAKAVVTFKGKETEVDLMLSEVLGDGGVEETHCEAYKAMMENWDQIVAEALQAALEYQNESWEDSDHTMSFPKFKTVEDVLDNIELFSIKIEARPPMDFDQDGRYIVLIFEAEWVNNDYRLLSVGLYNEKVDEVTDQDL